MYNSLATEKFWNSNDTIKIKSSAIQNGQELKETNLNEAQKILNRKILFNAENEIVIALIGRISRWKGQLILLEAFKILVQKHNNIKLAFIGSTPPNQEEFLDNLMLEIKQSNLEDKVIIIPFQEQIAAVWYSIDIAVVPSTEPEPFGLVALEAMLAKKPVVASNHGGLSEIVVNNETGFLVEPSNPTALAIALEQLISNPEMRNDFGKSGFERAKKVFSVEQYVNSLERLFDKMYLK